MRTFSLAVICALQILLGPRVKTVHSFSRDAPNSYTPKNDVESSFPHSLVPGVVNEVQLSRKSFLSTVVLGVSAITAAPQPSVAAKRYVLDDETGEYIEQDDEGNWQAEWKSRYDKMQTMSKDEIFMAARGAGNTDQKDLENESPASKRRRAFSGCRDKPTRVKLGNIDEKSCTKRVLEGDIEFVLNAL